MQRIKTVVVDIYENILKVNLLTPALYGTRRPQLTLEIHHDTASLLQSH